MSPTPSSGAADDKGQASAGPFFISGTRDEDTIAAAATPPGRGAIGVVRMSGPSSHAILDRLFVRTGKGVGLEPMRLCHGWLHSVSGTRIDEVMAVRMPGPGTYTGEDAAEVHCHGGAAVVDAVLAALVSAGARPAGPGEFTFRAFMNGKMDLSQAEAVAEMIDAASAAGAALAGERLAGGVRRAVEEMFVALVELRTALTVAVDFPEEEVECLPLERLIEGISGVREGIGTLLRNYERTKVFRRGAGVVLAGEVNAGKSSLLNAFLGRRRAIVSPRPGTTRDYIEESIELSGVAVRLTDTAGLRPTRDDVEAEGITSGREAADAADLVLFVHDASRAFSRTETDFLESFPAHRLVVVQNKSDLESHPLSAAVPEALGVAQVRVCALSGEGVDELAATVRSRLVGGGPEAGAGGVVAPNARQQRLLRLADEELHSVQRDAAAHIPYDLLGVGVERACDLLGEITGAITSHAVLEEIFSRFCIGK